VSAVAYFTAPFLVFAAVTAVAAVAGVALGPAATIGAFAFAIALVAVLLRDPAPPRR
jgi:hypothetical protein